MQPRAHTLLESLSTEIIMASPDDHGVFGKIQAKLEELSQLEPGQIPLLPKAASAAIEFIKSQQEKIPPTKILEILTSTVTSLQTLVNSPSQTPEFPAELGLDKAADQKEESTEGTLLSGNPEIITDFISTANEHLAETDSELLKLEEEPENLEPVHAIFRTFHSIKGVAGFLKLQDLIALAGQTESLLEKVREGSMMMVGDVIDTVFESVDMMKLLMRQVTQAFENNLPLKKEKTLPGFIQKIQKLMKADPNKLGEILESEGKISHEDVQKALAIQKNEENSRKLGEILVDEGKTKKEDVADALKQQKGRGNMKVREMIRVDLDRVDRLVEMIGEVVIAEAMVGRDAEAMGEMSSGLRSSLNQLNKIVRELQNVGTEVRMVPMGGLFQKMARMTKDLGKKIGKPVNFLSRGDDTEIDRRMAEQLYDPLVHMVRNSVDHGIEPEDIRRDAGKSLTGLITMSAYHAGSHIIIEIQDDGGGLDKQAILKKAISRGLVKENDSLSDEDIFNLIFMPGFSTASQVTEISGRGVGMDVVKSNIESMHGRITVSSSPESGTKFKIILPLTWAIIDGVLITCGRERYLIPLLSIAEFIQPDASMISSFGVRGELISLRGEITPFLRLYRLLRIRGAKKDPTQGLVLVLQSPDRRCALLVDDVVSQQKVVIKSLGEGFQGYQNTEYVAGAAILSDGQVCLILNVDELGILTNQIAKEMAQAHDELSAHSQNDESRAAHD